MCLICLYHPHLPTPHIKYISHISYLFLITSNILLLSLYSVPVHPMVYIYMNIYNAISKCLLFCQLKSNTLIEIEVNWNRQKSYTSSVDGYESISRVSGYPFLGRHLCGCQSAAHHMREGEGFFKAHLPMGHTIMPTMLHDAVVNCYVV